MMRLSREKLEKLAPSKELAALLGAMEYERSTICGAVLAAVRPKLDKISPAPQEGWLACAYAELCHGLFPDPNHQDLPNEIQQGLSLLIPVLDAALSCEDAPFDALTDLFPFEDALCSSSRVKEEYARFLAELSASRYLLTLRLAREIMPFDPASHTIGVRNIAVHTALLAAQAGLPADVPLVAAASLCHDIGKFACRGEDAKRIPYLHYYYTWQWLTERDMEHIAHISANHSTWDLEFENLPIESLLLIYADFRVRGTRENGREVVRIYPLSDAYEMIMSKLADVTPEKQKRYRLVYSKLRDFEQFLRDRGVGTELTCTASEQRVTPDVALLSAEEALDALRDLTFDNNIRLMHTISTDASFDLLLEQARGEKNTHRIRTYLRLFDEYNTYMTRASKQKLLSFLYELLMYPEGDVRRIAGNIMGEVLANSGPKYRKELPAAAPKEAMAPTMLALLDESVSLWDSYIEMCLHPDHKIAQKHALRISNSLKAICETLFTSCESRLAPTLAEPLFAHLDGLPGAECFVLLDALCHVPCTAVSPALFERAEPQLLTMLQSGTPRWQIVALRCIEHLQPCASEAFLRKAAVPTQNEDAVVTYLRQKLCGAAPALPTDIGLVYLSNLKNAVHWTVKNVQIDLLCDDVALHPENAFHTAMHLSNLLSVSEHLPVREHAGKALLRIALMLRVDQRNEIAVDLMRELENGQEQIARFIPDYLGKLLCTLPEKEIVEAVDFLEEVLRSGTVRPAAPVLRTLGSLIAFLSAESTEIIDRCLGLLLTGVAHYHSAIHQTALSVLCHDVIANEALPSALRCHCFMRVSKKLLALLSEPSRGKLTFFNRAAMLNYLYRFMVRFEVENGSFAFPAPKPVAFFPGTFDPFSAGHKQIVREIRARGFEVYLAVDEFSWSKRTLPKLLRRKIAHISVADQWDTYLFPDDLPINIAMPQDLARLRACFPEREIYLVAGSDVIRNASAYRTSAAGCAAEFNHIIVRRPAAEEEGLPPVSSLLRGKVIEFFLPEQLENISSSRIREYIDKNLDVSALVDPIVQAYIYEYGLYLRSPMLKRVLTPQEYAFGTPSVQDAPPELFEFLHRTPRPSAVALYRRGENRPIAWAYGHTTGIADLYGELHDVEACSSVRRCTSGKLLVVDGVHAAGEQTRALLNELLVRSLSSDHTYALCRCTDDPALLDALTQLGFIPVENTLGLYYVDMRAPMVLIQDVLLCIKNPHHDAPEVTEAIRAARPRLRRALGGLYPGKLLLCFDAELLNQSLMFKVQQHNNVLGLEGKHLGNLMCVPYGKILSDEIVPNTVTKTLHVDKSFAPNGGSFSVVEYPGYSPLKTQVRTIKAFRRSVILVDDLLHKGYRIGKLNPLFEQEGLEISRIIVGILSGRGRDLMREQHRQVDCEYFIPNLHYWVTESLLYPFIGGDSVSERPTNGRMLPSANLILPYFYPRHFVGTPDSAVRELSRTALENALAILRALETAHQRTFSTALTLRRLGEAIAYPRLPDRGKQLSYDFSVPASAYLEDDLLQLDRIRMRGDAVHGA